MKTIWTVREGDGIAKPRSVGEKEEKKKSLFGNLLLTFRASTH